MSSTFNPQILIEKLTKLNASQASIETLSHWCIFHMNKAKNVVETWNKQFHSSPREQRLSFLYLANDILQNSRRKGADFVAEFWKVLPDALRDVIQNGDASGKNQARRLINIWDERKVFGSRGHILKEEFVGKQPENSAKIGKQLSFKLRQSGGSSLDNIVSGYEMIYGGQVDEDVVLSQCTNVISSMEKVKKDVSSSMTSGKADGDKFVEEYKRQHGVLRGCIQQLTAVEASRAGLVSHLREALHEQELKLDQVRTQLQAAVRQADEAAKILNPSNTQPNSISSPLPMDGKSAAAAVAAKLTASTSSAQMLTFVLSSLAQEGVIATSAPPPDHPPEKKLKLDNDQSSPAPLMPPYPMPTSQYMQTVGPMSNVPYTYGTGNPIPVYPHLAPPQVSGSVPYQSFQGSEGGFYPQQQPPPPMAPISRQ